MECDDEGSLAIADFFKAGANVGEEVIDNLADNGLLTRKHGIERSLAHDQIGSNFVHGDTHKSFPKKTVGHVCEDALFRIFQLSGGSFSHVRICFGEKALCTPKTLFVF